MNLFHQDTPARGLQARMVSIDIINTIAAVRLELDDWNGHRYTDLLALLKANGEWKMWTRSSMSTAEKLHPLPME